MKKNAPDNHRYLDGDSGPLPLWVKNLSFVGKIPEGATALKAATYATALTNGQNACQNLCLSPFNLLSACIFS